MTMLDLQESIEFYLKIAEKNLQKKNNIQIKHI